MTYSIVALDPATGELGVAVQTRWLAVGSMVGWVEPGVGAVASQSFSEPAYGYHGVRLMREGRTPAEALAALIADDADEAVRQVGMVDAAGRSAAHTGGRCVRYASHLVAPGVSVQANMMERSTVPAAMLAAFGAASGDLADRLLAALRAAEGEGGDVRKQSAAIVVAQEPWRGDKAPESAASRAARRQLPLHPGPAGSTCASTTLAIRSASWSGSCACHAPMTPWTRPTGVPARGRRGRRGRRLSSATLAGLSLPRFRGHLPSRQTPQEGVHVGEAASVHRGVQG
jgi:uncharacterized Ntn-hydrolase superfamily protein